MQLATVDSIKVNRQVIFTSFGNFDHTLSLPDLYRSPLLCLLLHKPHLFSLNTTQVYFNSINYSYVYATCLGLYLGHPQACQHKGPFLTVTIFVMLKRNIRI
jgi:hypothetical protein